MTRAFAFWLQQELESRGWNQSDLARAARQRGYTLGTAQVSRILNQEQEAGISSVIAIAHGLGISRESAFRARGWLLAPSGVTPLAVADHSIQKVALALMDLSPEQVEEACQSILTLLKIRVR